MTKTLKPIPKFASEQEERDFWDTADTSEYFDWSQAKRAVFPNLKLSTRTITLRLPEGLYNSLKVLANKNDVPYQSLMKLYLSEKVKQEMESMKPVAR
jgi:predicted DNA binding CopG/RHH family protein